jgi:hypothetical protein
MHATIAGHDTALPAYVPCVDHPPQVQLHPSAGPKAARLNAVCFRPCSRHLHDRHHHHPVHGPRHRVQPAAGGGHGPQNRGKALPAARHPQHRHYSHRASLGGGGYSAADRSGAEDSFWFCKLQGCQACQCVAAVVSFHCSACVRHSRLSSLLAAAGIHGGDSWQLSQPERAGCAECATGRSPVPPHPCIQGEQARGHVQILRTNPLAVDEASLTAARRTFAVLYVPVSRS